jgi:hypothetical protein
VNGSSSSLLLGALAIGLLLLLAPRLLGRFGVAVRMTGLLRRAGGAADRDLERASAYHRALTEADRGDALDERTWTDLDLDAVFASIDRTVSEPGRQLLYHVLRTPTCDRERLRRFESIVQSVDR